MSHIREEKYGEKKISPFEEKLQFLDSEARAVIYGGLSVELKTGKASFLFCRYLQPDGFSIICKDKRKT